MGNNASAGSHKVNRVANEKAAAAGQGFLTPAYKGPVVGRLESGTIGTVLLAQPGLESRIVDAILHSLGPVDDVQLLGHDDADEFTIEMDNPTKEGYKPFFYNRRAEYGRHHCYWEALCHTLPLPPPDSPAEDLIIKTASARYANRREGLSIDSLAIPATLEIQALVDCVREINAPLLEKIRLTLVQQSEEKGASITPQLAQKFVDGIFRNVAIQIHFNAASKSVQETMHLDHINSCIHMAVTINGRRAVGLNIGETVDEAGMFAPKFFEMGMEKGDIYLTSPTSVLHGIHIEKLSEEDRSVALQLRTLVSVETANALMLRPNVHLLLHSILRLLGEESTDMKVRMPTWDEFQKALQNRKEKLGTMRGPDKLTYTNYFKPSTAATSAPLAEGNSDPSDSKPQNPY